MFFVRYSVFKVQLWQLTSAIVFPRIRKRSLFSRGRTDNCHRGGKGIRTPDPLLAGQVLSQLSYTPKKSGSLLLSHAVSSIVPSAA